MGVALAPAAFAAGEAKALDRINSAAEVLGEMMNASDKGIPQDLINKAQCVVVIPNMKKAGFIVGGEYGKGFATCRKLNGHGWTSPAAITIGGGSFGFQIGGAEQDIIMLVMNRSGMNHLMSDKFTIGGDATAAAGPIGRDASAQTDAAMHAEILSYSRARGIFGGLTLNGAVVKPDKDTDRELYGSDIGTKAILMGQATPPAGADALTHALDRDSMRRDR
jgi:lipid-binding SYLF domain-containing protein